MRNKKLVNHHHAWKNSGETIVAYCRKSGINIQSLYNFRHKLAKKQKDQKETSGTILNNQKFTEVCPNLFQSTDICTIRFRDGTVFEFLPTNSACNPFKIIAGLHTLVDRKSPC